MKRWVVLFLLLMMVPMPALAQDSEDSLEVNIQPDDKELNFYGFADEDEIFVDYLQLTATDGDVDRFRFTINDLKRVGDGGVEIPRTRVKFAGDKTLRDGLPKVFPVTINGVVKEPGTYEGNVEIVPTTGQARFEPQEIQLKLQATPKPGLFTAAQISPLAIAQVGFILFLLVSIVLIAVLVIRTGIGKRSMHKDEKSWLDYGQFYVVTWGIVAVILGLLSVLLFVDRFDSVSDALGFLTAFFGAVVGLVGTFFGVKSSSDAAAGAQKLAAASGEDTTPPQVLSTNPPDNDDHISVTIHPSATFSKDMDPITINAQTFKLLDQVTGQQVQPSPLNGVVYDEQAKVATFTPNADLQNSRRYGATITADVKDKAGNPLTQDKTWHFTTA